MQCACGRTILLSGSTVSPWEVYQAVLYTFVSGADGGTPGLFFAHRMYILCMSAWEGNTPPLAVPDLKQ
jgi:hypothetical protein